MISIKKLYSTLLVLSLLLMISSCEDLADVNINPNGIDPAEVNPNFLITNVLTTTGKFIPDFGYSGRMAAAMQQVQKDSWGTTDNNLDWLEDKNIWSNFYRNLSNNNLAYNRSVELNLEFQQGVTLVMKSFLFGFLTDFYGDIPYSEALQGADAEGTIYPKFDAQEEVYKGIIADLKTAAVLLSKNSYEGINAGSDVYFNGDPGKWLKFANSLALRFYMRLSEKLPAYAQNGVTEILGQPLITSVTDECSMDFLGISESDAWPNSGTTGTPSEFSRMKPSATLTYKLVELNDPRRHVWFAPVEIPIKVVPAADFNLGGGNDVTTGGVRYLNEDNLPANTKIYNPATHYADRKAGLKMIDTSSVYVGLPSATSSSDLFDYNLNASSALGGDNKHVSSMNAIFNKAEGTLLKARLLSAAEVQFLMAEAAVKGWGPNAETHYNAGVKASLEAWGIGSKYANYIDNDGVAFDGSMEMLMEQKWIAGFTNTTEAYLDWRRTGLPMLEVGPAAKEVVMPLRFIYAGNDVGINPNYDAALGSLEGTQYGDGNSLYAKNWLQQGVPTPW